MTVAPSVAPPAWLLTPQNAPNTTATVFPVVTTYQSQYQALWGGAESSLALQKPGARNKSFRAPRRLRLVPQCSAQAAPGHRAAVDHEVSPVMNEESSLARKATSLPISSGRPNLGSRCGPVMNLRTASGSG